MSRTHAGPRSHYPQTPSSDPPPYSSLPRNAYLKKTLARFILPTGSDLNSCQTTGRSHADHRRGRECVGEYSISCVDMCRLEALTWHISHSRRSGPAPDLTCAVWPSAAGPTARRWTRNNCGTSLPPQLDCAFESICETCSYFQTTIEFRPALVAQHDHAAARGQTARPPGTLHQAPQPDRRHPGIMTT
jgi:hypothetical protein